MNTILNVVLFLVIIGFYLLAQWQVPQYLNLYYDLGAQLPGLTHFSLKSHDFWWLALIIPVVIQYKLITRPELKKSKKVTGILIVMILLVAAIFSLLLFGLHLPLMNSVNGE